MERPEQYRKRARDCRALAAKLESEIQRDLLHRMAWHLDSLAGHIETLAATYPALRFDDGPDPD